MTTTQFRTGPDTHPTALAAQTVSPQTVDTQSRGADRHALRPLAIDLGVPLASYFLLHKIGFDVVTSLALSSVVPAARTVARLIKSRTLNGMATLILAVNLVSIAISFWSGNPRIMLAKDGAVTSTIGIAILISVFAGRPLMTAAMRPFIVKGDAAKAAAFDLLKVTSPRFRRLERWFSAVWGVAFLLECALRVFCAFTLPVGTMVWLSMVITLGAIAVGIFVSSIFSLQMEKMVKLETGQ